MGAKSASHGGIPAGVYGGLRGRDWEFGYVAVTGSVGGYEWYPPHQPRQTRKA